MKALDYNTNKVVKNIFDQVFQNGFSPFIQRPSRVIKASGTKIDHFLTNRVIENEVQSRIIKSDISDHFPIFTVLTTNKTCLLEKILFIKRDISNENFDSFTFLLQNIKCDKTYSLDRAYQNFYSIFSDLYHTAFPKRAI